jgi:hypothetical protein
VDGKSPLKLFGDCDAPICDRHRMSIGPEKDLCPDCGERLAIVELAS